MAKSFGRATTPSWISFGRFGTVAGSISHHFSSGSADGQIYAIFVIMLAAAEAAVGLAIVLAIFQIFHTIDVEAAETLRE